MKYRINHMGTILFEGLIKNQKLICDIHLILKILTAKQFKIDELKEGKFIFFIKKEEKKLFDEIKFGCFIAKNDDIAITCRKGSKNIRIMINDNTIKNLIGYINSYLIE